jgi:hypothetical protein
MMTEKLDKLFGMNRLRAVPVSEPETWLLAVTCDRERLTAQTLNYSQHGTYRESNLGAGRGGRTPTRLPSADFESAFCLLAAPRNPLQNVA